MSWLPLEQFRDPAVPKLNNLRRAADAGLRTPTTWWTWASDLSPATDVPPSALGPSPWIIRSGSPTEDTRESSNAGQLLSLPVRAPTEFPVALRRVVEAMPRDGAGKPRGAAFLQPLVQAVEAGVAFFDGYYFERTAAGQSNEALTSGHARGNVVRGQLARGDAWSDWLQRVYDVFRGDRRIDIEFARDSAGFVLLQARPALFPVRRNPLLSLTNHKEILGDPPSPWITSVLVAAGRDLSFMAIADRRIREWDETYAVGLAERAWMNLSFWYRWMDHFGLPRTMVSRNFGGETTSPMDGRIIWRRFLPSIPSLFRFQFACLAALPGLRREFRVFDRVIENSNTLPELHAAMVHGLSLALRSNFAINAALAGILKVRKFLRIPGKARVITEQMMEDYRRLSAVSVEERAKGLDHWLERYGHRGPLESDPSRPRFAELRDVLLHDLNSMPVGQQQTLNSESWLARRFRFCFRVDEIREWFRDSLMRRWQTLRQRVLTAAQLAVAEGLLDRMEDVFWLRGEDLGRSRFQELVQRNRQRHEAAKSIEAPLTATAAEIETMLANADRQKAHGGGRQMFPGISLNPTTIEGIVRKADDLIELLRDSSSVGPNTILVVPTLEPSWAVVFARVAGVVADVGGELSHASILLRETRKPALVNCTGIYAQIETGDRLRINGIAGVAEVLGRSEASRPGS